MTCVARTGIFLFYFYFKFYIPPFRPFPLFSSSPISFLLFIKAILSSASGAKRGRAVKFTSTKETRPVREKEGARGKSVYAIGEQLITVINRDAYCLGIDTKQTRVRDFIPTSVLLAFVFIRRTGRVYSQPPVRPTRRGRNNPVMKTLPLDPKRT